MSEDNKRITRSSVKKQELSQVPECSVRPSGAATSTPLTHVKDANLEKVKRKLFEIKDSDDEDQAESNQEDSVRVDKEKSVVEAKNLEEKREEKQEDISD